MGGSRASRAFPTKRSPPGIAGPVEKSRPPPRRDRGRHPRRGLPAASPNTTPLRNGSRPIPRSSRPSDPENMQHRASHGLFFRPIGPKFQALPTGGGGALSERKSGLEIGVDAAKLTQDAIGPASRRPTSCGFADGAIGKACNPLKRWVTSDNSQYVNQVKLGAVVSSGQELEITLRMLW